MLMMFTTFLPWPINYKTQINKITPLQKDLAHGRWSISINLKIYPTGTGDFHLKALTQL
jgi:hypothetical protein